MSLTMDLYLTLYNEAQKNAFRFSLCSYNNITTNQFETIDQQVVNTNTAQCIVSYNASQQTYVLHITMKHKSALRLQCHNKKTHQVWHKKYSLHQHELQRNFNVDSRLQHKLRFDF